MPIKDIPIKKLVPNPWNMNSMSGDMFRRLVENMKTSKIRDPILARPHPEKKGFFQIVDGYHRWKACRKLGFDIHPVDVIDLNDEDAKLYTINMNYLRGEADQNKLDKVVADIVRVVGQDRAKAILPYSGVDISNMMRASEERLNDVVKQCTERKSASTKRNEIRAMLLTVGPLTPEEVREVHSLLKKHKSSESSEGAVILKLVRLGADTLEARESSSKPARRNLKSSKGKA